MTTIKYVSAHAGVSIMTVSRFFNTLEKVSERTKQIILNAMVTCLHRLVHFVS
ncbi:LacI family DNA-binding transcriptional regulator [Candidatus Latescibacterota bacterium]